MTTTRRAPPRFATAAALACAALAVGSCAADDQSSNGNADADDSEERAELTPASAPQRYAAALRGRPRRVVVKFQEGSGIRLRDGHLRAELSAATARPARDVEPAALARVDAELRSHGARLKRLFGSVPDETLAALRQRGEARVRRALADLRLYHEIPVDAGASPAELERLRDYLSAQPMVEFAYLESDPAPPPDARTPDFVPNQRYRGPAPSGVDVDFAHALPGGRGAGVRVVDVEDLLTIAHEDLPPLAYTHGYASGELQRSEHTVAVAGVLVGRPNAFGISGIAPEASYGSSSVYPWTATSSAEAILAPLADGFLREGDVMLLELQRVGPEGATCTCAASGCYGYAPEEYAPASFDAIATATANGVVVIEPVGNGAVSLDDPAFGGTFDRSARDSGAILVAARYANSQEPLCFTNGGSRVDLHAWGEGVASAGFGDAYAGANSPSDHYTFAFSGTSSAAAIVAGAVASMQGIARARYGRPLTPHEVRALLVASGTPQLVDAERVPIGVQPDLRAAVAALQPDPPRGGVTLLADFESDVSPFAVASHTELAWTRAKGPTPTIGTGPEGDHTNGGGSYLYLEASGWGVGYPRKTALLESACLDLRDARAARFQLFFHMRGSDTGALYVEADPGCDGEATVPLFAQVGGRTGGERNGYVKQTIDLGAMLGGSLRVRLRGVTGDGPYGDIAVDDLSIELDTEAACASDDDCAKGACMGGACTSCEEFTGTTQQHLAAARAVSVRRPSRVEARVVGSDELLESRALLGQFSNAPSTLATRVAAGYRLGACAAN